MRKDGYYWVKYKDNEKWSLVQWLDDAFYSVACRYAINELSFSYISKKPIKEPKTASKGTNEQK